MKPNPQPGFETRCMHLAEDRPAQAGAVAPPIYQNSTFTFPDCQAFIERQSAEPRPHDYTRVSNPTTEILERKIASIENAEAARAFASGMAAISAAVLSCVKAGDHIITIETVYGPTQRLLAGYLPRFGIETTFVRGTSVDEFRDAMRPSTKLLYLESPSSVLFELQDLKAVAALAQEAGVATICDNSNATPYLQNPLDFGIDLVLHTATKYIGGHSDLVAGLVAGSRERLEHMSEWEGQLLGSSCDPFASWLMLRGLRTLPVRMERHRKNATELTRLLESDARVARVNYDGLESHPQAFLARKQMRGHSGMFSFELRNNTRETTFAVVDALKHFCIAVSWGGYESLAIPVEVVHPEDGKPRWVIRVSTGLETIEDLKADLYQALSAADG